MCTAFHLLYDLAARAQDLVVLEYGELLSQGGTKWKMKKTKVDRKGLLAEDTIQLLKDLQDNEEKKDSDKIYPC